MPCNESDCRLADSEMGAMKYLGLVTTFDIMAWMDPCDPYPKRRKGHKVGRGEMNEKLGMRIEEISIA